MIRIIVCIFLICTCKLSSCCEKNWYHCEKNEDCCSGFCNKPSEPGNGICEQPCGSSYKPTVSLSRPAEHDEFPWHAGIYKYKKGSGSYDQRCGGTLISDKVVISAAHCFVKETENLVMRKLSDFKIVVGKHSRSFNASEDKFQVFGIKNIEIPEQYKGAKDHYSNDIAFLTLDTEVKFTNNVQPICIDFDQQEFENDVLGKIVGWGIKNGDSSNDELKVVEIPYVKRENCVKEISNKLVHYVTDDKVCAGDKYSSVSLCKGDSGGGLVFQDLETKAYYLHGVLSLHDGKCEGGEYSLFTKLSFHMKMVERYLGDCKGVCKQNCGKSLSDKSNAKILNEESTEYEIFPWHAIVYQFNESNDSYDQICGGTLITSNVVISAASCLPLNDYFFPEDKVFSLKDLVFMKIFLKIAVGKRFKTFNAHKDAFAQIADVDRIEIPFSLSPPDEEDIKKIVYIKLKTGFEYNRFVQPVCLDWRFTEEIFFSLQHLKTVSWGRTAEKSISNRLNTIKIPVAERGNCLGFYSSRNYKNTYYSYFMCVDHLSNGVICNDDSGGGIVCESPFNQKYFLLGIVSLKNGHQCKEKDHVLFPKAGYHQKNFVEKYLELDCEPLTSPKLTISCFFPEKTWVPNDGTISHDPLYDPVYDPDLAPDSDLLSRSCNEPLLDRSIATFSCNSTVFTKIKEPEYDTIKCYMGKWNRPLTDDFCDISCGTSVVNKNKRISKPVTTKYEKFPWHAAIYEYNETNVYDFICQGTLISYNVLVTSQHCVTVSDMEEFEKKKKNAESLRVGLGMYNGWVGFYDSSNNISGKLVEIENIETQEDIAFVTLKTTMEILRFVRHICIDMDEDSFENEISEKVTGMIVSWISESDGLKMIKVPLFPSSQCEILKNKNYFDNEMDLCLGDENLNLDFCESMKGASLVTQDPESHAFILRGIFSGCHEFQSRKYALFMKLSPYKYVFGKYLQNCIGLCEQRCGISTINQPKPVEVRERKIDYEKFPWRAGIFQYNEGSGLYEKICGGTIISSKVVISAARCVTTEKIDKNGVKLEKISIKDLSTLKVALEQHYKPLNTFRDVATQIINIENVEISSHYKGAAHFYANDIAFLTMQTDIIFTRNIQPICLGGCDEYFEYRKDKMSIVGREKRLRKIFKDQTRVIQMKLVPADKCKSERGDTITPNEDKICAEKKIFNAADYEIDTGEGLVLKRPSDQYCLHGIFLPFQDKESSYALFTNLFFHKELVKKYTQDINNYTGNTCGHSVSYLPAAKVSQVKPGQYPWHAGIYRYNLINKKYDQICAGTLISRKTIISSARCFSVKSLTGYVSVSDLSIFKAGLGKYYRDLDSPQDDLPQILALESVGLVMERLSYYRPIGLAFIKLKTEVEYSTVVRPVCLDIHYPGDANFDDDLKKRQLEVGSTGKILVWETRPENSDEKLKVIEMPLMSYFECSRLDITDEYSPSNLICTEDKFMNITFSNANKGAGLIIEDEETKLNYLRGIFFLEGKNGNVKKSELDQRNTGCAIFIKLDQDTIFGDEIKSHLKRDGFFNRNCGRSVLKSAKPTISEAERKEFPWHAGIYQCNSSSGSCKQICGGTLISRKIVISAAHCFMTEEKPGSFNLIDISKLKVAVGNHYRILNSTEDTLTQIVDVKNIEISPQYLSSANFYANDIAYVILKPEVEYNEAVRPVCVDTREDFFEEEQLKKKFIGKIASWGKDKIEENNTLKVIQLPLVSRDECITEIGSELTLSVSGDKVCGGDKASSVSLCDTDRGSGLVFQNLTTGKYVLRGIYSLGPSDCKGKDYVLFTKLSSHKEFLKKYYYQCDGICEASPMECEPVASRKLTMICFGLNGKPTRCDKPLPNNSKVTFYCNTLNYQTVEKAKYNSITCRNGQWDRPLLDDFCEAACGKSVPMSNYQHVVVHGKEILHGEFPWHAGLYEFKEKSGTYVQICGGTIISHKVVITAAHCVSAKIITQRINRKVILKNSSTLKVAVGNYYRACNTSQDALAQILEVENIEIPPQYVDHLAFYDNDIAFITLKKKAEYNALVAPICLDIGDVNFEDKQLKKGAIGIVPGWAFRSEQNASDVLQLAEMPFIPKDECLNKISRTLVLAASRDKIICAGNETSKMTVCRGDSGGGLVFEDTATKVYYLRGIVSLGPKGCKGEDFAIFTKLSPFRALIEKYLKLT